MTPDDSPHQTDFMFHSPNGDDYGVKVRVGRCELSSHRALIRQSPGIWVGRSGEKPCPSGGCISAFALRVGLRNRHRGHYCKEGSEETAAVQDLPVVPGQRVPRDEDVLGHHRLRGGKEPVPRSSIQPQAETSPERVRGKEGKSLSASRVGLR